MLLTLQMSSNGVLLHTQLFSKAYHLSYGSQFVLFFFASMQKYAPTIYLLYNQFLIKLNELNDRNHCNICIVNRP